MAAPARTWRIVLEHIERELLDARLVPGDRLPPERELATALGVGRSSVREALRALVVMGLIRTGTGSGPSSGAIIIATPEGGMAALLRLQVAARGFPLDDVVDTRLVLEESVVEALAGSRGVDLAASDVLMDAMDAPDLTPADFLALDAQLHQSLADASGNTVVAAVMGGLRTAIESYVLAGAESIADWGDTAARLRAEHRAIVAAIRRGSAADARELVHAHITDYYLESHVLARPVVVPHPS